MPRVLAHVRVYLRARLCSLCVCVIVRAYARGWDHDRVAADNRSHARSSESREPLKDRARSHGVAEEEALLPINVAVRVRAVSAAAARVNGR